MRRSTASLAGMRSKRSFLGARLTWERETEVILEMVLPEEHRLPKAEARYPLAAAGFRF